MVTSTERGAATAVPQDYGCALVSQDISECEWNYFVESCSEATGYHRWEWRRVFGRAFGHRTVYLSATSNGRIVGVLPLVLFDSWLFGRFGVSLPFVNYGGVLARSDETKDALVASAQALAREERLSYVELRHLGPRCPQLPSKTHKVAMTMCLPSSSDALWQTLDRKVRNQVRKADKSGLTAVRGGAELITQFYGVFARNMRDLGTPVYPRRFFEAILAEFPDSTDIFVVHISGKPVAASITYRWRGAIDVLSASSLREHRTAAPNMLLYWTMLQHAIASRCTTFDFGRSTPNEGTYQFKRQWGAEPAPLAWEYVLLGGHDLPNQSPTNPKFRLAIEMWKRLPVRMATWVGPAIVRSIP